ncbi:MAG: hypothetical protein MZU97_17945 [Bacillus subtilis]|nr:hypothetical protein [Bacillus subtilis]
MIEADKRVYPIKDYPFDIEGKTIRITAPVDAKSVVLYQDRIAAQLRKNGFEAIIEIRFDEDQKTIQDQIEKTNITFVANNETAMVAAIKFEVFYPDKPLETTYTKIVNIPTNAIELEEYKAKNKNKAVFTFKGAVVEF